MCVTVVPEYVTQAVNKGTQKTSVIKNAQKVTLGNLCSQECNDKTWGQNCSQKCDAKCKKNSCNHVTGECYGCVDGYRGRDCNSECDEGFYGEGCNKTCSEHCGGDLNSCHHVNGSCNQGCDPGYTGSLCIQECNVTTWGQNCSQNCNASCMNNSCSHETGECSSCVVGYWGRFCNHECNTTSYGEGCRQTCSANCVNQLCHHETGFCNSCNESRLGDYCEFGRQQGVSGGGATVSAVVAVLVILLVILAVVAGVFIWRNWKQKATEKRKDENDIHLSNWTFRFHTAQFEECEAENGEVTAASAPTNSVTDTIAVSVQELKTYIQQHSVDSHFLDQFLSVPMTSGSPQTCGVLPENVKKNRYKNIIP
ncbi:hypothetical protein RRG08_004556, partial [Elysia crispata]